jgi:hypothetical protein
VKRFCPVPAQNLTNTHTFVSLRRVRSRRKLVFLAVRWHASTLLRHFELNGENEHERYLRPRGARGDTGRLKHLVIIQQSITLMAGNSCLLNGWSVTLLSAILGIAVKDGMHRDAIWSNDQRGLPRSRSRSGGATMVQLDHRKRASAHTGGHSEPPENGGAF